MKNMSKTDDFLGYDIDKTNEGIMVTQSVYFMQLVRDYGYHESNSVYIPATENPKGKKSMKLGVHNMNKIAGSIGWATKSRPDICYAFSKLAQGIKDSSDEAYLRAARLLRYINSTQAYGLWFPAKVDLHDPIVAYVDSSWGHEASETGDNCTSRSGYIVYFYGAPVCWGSKKQTVVALSSTEAEIYAATEGIKEVLAVKHLAEELGIVINRPIPIYEDNTGVIALSKRNVISKRTKHIAIRHCFMNDCVKQGLIEFRYVKSEDNIADMLTKPLMKSLFQKHMMTVVKEKKTV